MKGTQIILDHLNGREAAARMVDGQLDDLLIDADELRPGAILRGVVDRTVKGQGGVFVRLPDGESGYLRGAKGKAPGQALLVQVSGYAEPGKAVPLTENILFKSRYAIVTPHAPGINIARGLKDEERRAELRAIAHDAMEGSQMGLILRSACGGGADDAIEEDITAMRALAEEVMADDGDGIEALTEGDGPHVLAWRDWTGTADVVTEPGGFADCGVLDALEDLKSPAIRLGAVTLYVEPTRALVAVDVNTPEAGFAAGLKANLACAAALPRALRVRGLGGQIVLDLAPMPKKDRKAFEAALRAAFKTDEIETTLLGWTPLGHFELQRKRARAPVLGLLP